MRDLERLLDKAYPGIQEPLRSQQLLDYFLADFATTVARARDLMLLEAIDAANNEEGETVWYELWQKISP